MINENYKEWTKEEWSSFKAILDTYDVDYFRTKEGGLGFMIGSGSFKAMTGILGVIEYVNAINRSVKEHIDKGVDKKYYEKLTYEELDKYLLELSLNEKK
jgi:hypothetical protein